MKFSLNFVQDYLSLKSKEAEKLAYLLTMHSFEVENIEKKGDDFIFDIAVLPNRAPDCFSHLGVAREFAVVSGSRFKEPAFKIKEAKTKSRIKVGVKDSKDCLRYSLKEIQNVKVGESPLWLKQRLESCGLRPVNNIVDITNYVMLETGQPMHAFDLNRISSPIIVRRAKEGEKIVTLDNKKFNLDKSILVIADDSSVLAIAGIKGGKKGEVDSNTSNIVLEAANFEQHLVRRASQKLNLKTDASLRFEHGLDPNLTEYALRRASYLIETLAKGEPLKGIVDVYKKRIVPKKLKLSLPYLYSLLGVKIPKSKVLSIFKALGFKILGSAKEIKVEIPTRRRDILIEEDLIEEVGRIYGYEKIKNEFPVMSLKLPEKNDSFLMQLKIKGKMKEARFTEVVNYSFISKDDKDVFEFDSLFELENPMSNEFMYLRPSLIPNLLKDIVKNESRFENIKIFELGKIYPGREKNAVSGLIASKDKKDFYYLKGVLNNLLHCFNGSVEYKESPSFFNRERCVEVLFNKKKAGIIGEISLDLLKKMKINSPNINSVFVFELGLEELETLPFKEKEYSLISQYPEALRDLSVLVPKETKAEDVLGMIKGIDSLIKEVELFDIYEGKEIEQGKKNLAFRIIYQSKEKTLTSSEIDEVHDKIIKGLEKNPQFKVRR